MRETVFLVMRNVEVIILRVLVIIGLCVAPFLATIGFKKGRANQSAETVEESKAGNAVTLAPKEDESTVVAETKTLGEELWGDRKSTPIEGVKEVIESFVGAETWQDALPYIYRSKELEGQIAAYYRDWQYEPMSDVTMHFFQMEMDPEREGPYWVYLVSADPESEGIPVIVREEDGEKKVDWEIYSEFNDRHFVAFLNGELSGDPTFRVVAERIESLDRVAEEAMGKMDDYLIYQLSAPYGELNENSTYAFAPKGTETAQRMDEVMGVADEPLATILTLGKKKVGDIVFYVIDDYVSEGWFSKE